MSCMITSKSVGSDIKSAARAEGCRGLVWRWRCETNLQATVVQVKGRLSQPVCFCVFIFDIYLFMLRQFFAAVGLAVGRASRAGLANLNQCNLNHWFKSRFDFLNVKKIKRFKSYLFSSFLVYIMLLCVIYIAKVMKLWLFVAYLLFCSARV